MSVEIPTLDPANEDRATAEAIAGLPDWLSDRNASALEVKTLEGAGAFYGALGYQSDTIPPRVRRQLLGVVGVTQQSGETVADMVDRAAAAARDRVDSIITKTEFAERAVEMDIVERATVTAGNDSGTMVVHAIDAGLNEDYPDETFRTDIEDELEPLNRVGHVIVGHDPQIRLVMVTDVDVVFVEGADPQAVTDRAETMFRDWITATGSDPWPWGEPLYANAIVARVDAIEGVERVVEVYGQYSDDYGATWSSVSIVEPGSPIEAGANGSANTLYGMLQWAGPDYSHPNDLSVTAAPNP